MVEPELNGRGHDEHTVGFEMMNEYKMEYKYRQNREKKTFQEIFISYYGTLLLKGCRKRE